jgi:hypothetical protein
MNLGSLDRDSDTPAPRTNTESTWASLNTQRRMALQRFVMKAEAIGWARIEARKSEKEGAQR